MNRVLQQIALVALVLIFCNGCETLKPAKAPKVPEQTAPELPVALAAGDVIRVSFAGAPELNQFQKVRADGKVSLPLVGEVDAAGKTLVKFQSELSDLYASQLQNREVIVSLEGTSTPVYIVGCVMRPGKILLDRPMTILEAIVEAGGFSPNADRTKVVLVRLEGGQHKTQMLDVSQALKGNAAPAFYVKPYDVINVKESIF